MPKNVAAVFDDVASASEAIDRLVELGISRDSISILMSDEACRTHFPGVPGKPERAVSGGAAGAGLGAIAGGLAGIGTLALSGAGLVAAGPLMAALVGAGAAAGGLLGALSGMGIPEDEARLAVDKIQQGGILISVEAADGDQADVIEDAMERAQGYSVSL